MKFMKLSIIIPAYNEEKNISKVIESIPSNLDEKTKIFVVNDGSNDKTSEIAKKAGAHVIEHEKNLGYGAALNSGFKKSLEEGFDLITHLDGDEQHSASDIKNLLVPLKNNEADVVIGSRFLTKKSNIPLQRKIGIIVVTKIINALTGLKITDSRSGYRAFNKKVLKELNKKENKMGFSTEFLFLVASKGFRIKEVPIICDYPENLKHSTPLFIQGIQLLFNIFQCSWRYKK